MDVNQINFQIRKPIQIGPFTITPYLADHSAFDSYSFVIAADGKRLFYSGDLRGHGWKQWAFEFLLKKPPVDIDAMLLEGTTMGRRDDEPTRSEAELVAPLKRLMTETNGMVLATFAGQNIDRFVTFYKAAMSSGRTFVVDIYIAHLLLNIGRKSLPDPTSDALRVFLPYRMRSKVIQNKSFDLISPFSKQRIYPDELKRHRQKLVMTFRTSMTIDLEKADCLVKGTRYLFNVAGISGAR